MELRHTLDPGPRGGVLFGYAVLGSETVLAEVRKKLGLECESRTGRHFCKKVPEQ